MATPEKSAITACTKLLVDGLSKEDIDRIAEDMLRYNLISGSVYVGLVFDKTMEERARHVMSSVTKRVEDNPKDNFVNFITVLTKNGLSLLAQLLEDKFGKLVFHKT